ncbi:MAG: hypothetical protein L6V93_18950 [Clostridiales bacterium]|nr:MAG: hypothetical protein L6V93_18950 [Clostridiales bacterium]
MPSEILSVFADGGTEAVFDVGGDEDGAVALGGFFNYIKKTSNTKCIFVINAMRPMTANEDDILELAHKIEEISRLKITDVVNNTNLAYLTEPSHIFKQRGADRKMR